MQICYDKAIVTCSSSKIYSMAGTRVGWIICHDPETRKELFNRRSYDSICGGVFDEWIFAIALEHVDKIYARSRKIISENKAKVDKWLDGHKYLHQYADSYGTTYLIHYDLDVDAEKFCNDLLDQKEFWYVMVIASLYHTHSACRFHMLLNLKKA